MKLIEAIHLFETENRRKSTFNDLPQIIQKYAPEREEETPAEALLQCLASFETEADDNEQNNNPEFDKRFQEISKELGIAEDDDDIDRNIEAIKLVIERHPEVFDLENPSDRFILENCQ